MSSTDDNHNKQDALTTQQQADIILNRANVALARSKRLIQSWLPPREDLDSRNGESRENNDEQSEDDDAFFKGMTEVGGIGSKNAYPTDDSLNSGILSGRKGRSGADDRLLEQLIGKRAAAARRKEKERQHQQKPVAANSKVGGSKINGTKSRNEADSESEAEEGRTARFSSKKSKGKKETNDVQHEETLADPSDDERPRKRKATSYLDELLASKKKKKKKS